jgi:hypothetical protein
MATPEQQAAIAAQQARRDTITSFFTYHPPTPEQQTKYVLIRERALDFGLMLDGLMPAGHDKVRAMDKLRELVTLMNQAIACNGAELPPG